MFQTCSQLRRHDLKFELQGKLNRARTADLIKRIESVTDSSAPERSAKHPRGNTELAATGRKAATHGAEVGMVKNVEEVCAKLNLNAVREFELPPQRQVCLKQRQSFE